MRRMWLVVICDIESSRRLVPVYGCNYFPRHFYYKREAQELVTMLKREYGADARVERQPVAFEKG